MHVDALAASAIPASPAHGVIHRRESARIGQIDVGALAEEILDYIIPAPECRAMYRRLLQAARTSIHFPAVREQQLQRGNRSVLDIGYKIVDCKIKLGAANQSLNGR